MKWTGAIGVPVIAGGVGTKLWINKQNEENVASASDWDKVVSTCSINNCGGRCVIKAYVKDGEVIRVATDTHESESKPAT